MRSTEVVRVGVRFEYESAAQVLFDNVVSNLANAIGTNATRSFLNIKAGIYDDTLLGVGIGYDITEIQRVFADIYSEPETFAVNGTQFDVLLGDGETLEFGSISITAMHVPGHTPACMAYLIGDALFVGDTLFMPDSGTARCDFPGGDARTLYQSIQRLFELPDETRVFVCHDYQPNGRELAFETTIGEQKTQNIHVRESISEAEFVSLRENRDAQLSMPKLILPSLQVNIRAGALPVHPVTRKPFITMPLNAFGGDDLKNIVENQ